MCFGVLFSGIASSSGTFGNEQVNYYREAASGLKSAPYFLGKWIADFPRVFFASVFFYLAFSSRFQDTNTNASRMFLLIFVFYLFSFSMGYLVSQLVTIIAVDSDEPQLFIENRDDYIQEFISYRDLWESNQS